MSQRELVKVELASPVLWNQAISFLCACLLTLVVKTNAGETYFPWITSTARLIAIGATLTTAIACVLVSRLRIVPIGILCTLLPVYSPQGIAYILIGLSMLAAWLERPNKSGGLNVGLAGILFAAWSGITLLWEPSLEASLEFILEFVPSLLLACAISWWIQVSPVFIRYALTSVMLGCLISIPTLLINYSKGVSQSQQMLAEFAGYEKFTAFQLWDALASWFMIGTILAAHTLFSLKKNKSYLVPLAISCLMLLPIGLALLRLRSAMVGLVVGLLVIVILEKRVGLFMLTISVLGAALLAVFAILPDIYYGLLDRFVSSGNQGFDAGRYDLWSEMLRMWREHPIEGIGWYNIAMEFPVVSIGGIVYKTNSHNIYIGVLTETGIVGLLVFFAWIALLVYNAKDSHYKTLVLALFFSCLVQGLFLHQLSYKHFWFALGLLAGAGQLRHFGNIAFRRKMTAAV